MNLIKWENEGYQVGILIVLLPCSHNGGVTVLFPVGTWCYEFRARCGMSELFW